MAFSSRLSCCLPAGSEEAVNLTDHPEEVFFFSFFLSSFYQSLVENILMLRKFEGRRRRMTEDEMVRWYH